MTDDDLARRNRGLDIDVERAGPSPPGDDDLAAAAASLLDATEPVDGVRLVRLRLAAGSDRDVARRLLAAIDEKLAVVGSTLPDAYDPAAPEVDVLVETDHEPDAVASALAAVDAVDGVVVASVTAAPARPGESVDAGGTEDVPTVEREGLSIYRLDDHLVVTEDFGALVERFRAELGDDDAVVTAREAREDVRRLDHRLSTLADRLEALESRVDAVADGMEASVAAVERTVDELEGALEEVGETAADRADLAELREHVEEEVPTRLEVEYVFAPAAERLDGEGTHPDMGSVVEEIDAELRRTHVLREAGLLDRVRWLLTGALPGDDESEPEDE